jgi:hypothetical protein
MTWGVTLRDTSSPYRRYARAYALYGKCRHNVSHRGLTALGQLAKAECRTIADRMEPFA